MSDIYPIIVDTTVPEPRINYGGRLATYQSRWYFNRRFTKSPARRLAVL